MQATVFVHPGYLRRTDGDPDLRQFVEATRTCQAYGSYHEYFSNLKRLYGQRGRSVFIVEREGTNLNPYHEGFEPSSDDVVLEWAMRNPDRFARLERSNGGYKETGSILLECLHAHLAMEGFDSFLLSGELGPYELHHAGCVGVVQALLSESTARGVKGCIFPIEPYREILTDDAIRIIYELIMAKAHKKPFRIDLEQHARMFQDLYDNAVDIPSSSGSAEPAGLSVGS